MKYFIRYTEKAQEDFERNESLHASGISISDSSIEEIAEMFDCDTDDIVILCNNKYQKNDKTKEDLCYFQKLNGLCGFELESDNLEDAIEEAENFNYNYVYNSKDMPNFAIYEGFVSGDCPEGTLFIASKLVYTI